MPRNVKTLGRSVFIFDMDGTITDSMPLWDAGIRDAAAELGVTLPDGYYGEIKTYTSNQVYAFLCEKHGMTAPQQEFEVRLDACVARLYPKVEAKPHADEVLAAYREKGDVVLLTNTSRAHFTPLLTRLDLMPYFTATWSCRETGGSKHTAVPFLKVLEDLGAAPSDALLFEDSFRYVSVAKELGIATVGVYDALSAGEEAEFRAAADLYVKDLGELFL